MFGNLQGFVSKASPNHITCYTPPNRGKVGVTVQNITNPHQIIYTYLSLEDQMRALQIKISEQQKKDRENDMQYESFQTPDFFEFENDDSSSYDLGDDYLLDFDFPVSPIG